VPPVAWSNANLMPMPLPTASKQSQAPTAVATQKFQLQFAAKWRCRGKEESPGCSY